MLYGPERNTKIRNTKIQIQYCMVGSWKERKFEFFAAAAAASAASLLMKMKTQKIEVENIRNAGQSKSNALLRSL